MFIFFFQAEDGIRDYKVTGVQTCALPIYPSSFRAPDLRSASPRRTHNRTRDGELAAPTSPKFVVPGSRSAGCTCRRRRPTTRHPQTSDTPARDRKSVV